jgi:hypothetical protein
VSQSGLAASLGTGSVITLADSYGTTGGGEFIANVVGGAASDSFMTFCLEKNEYFTPGTNLYVKDVTTSAVSGGISGGNPDPIGAQTAYLYTMFSNQTLSNYDFFDTGAARIADANSLQKAIWYFENEISNPTDDAQAVAWIDEAKTATFEGGSWFGKGIGNVQVLNLYKDAAYTQFAQDQLYIAPIPEPEIYAMMAAGLGLMGFVARRRKQAAA